METYLVMALYMLIVLGMVLLTDAPESKVDPSKRRLYAMVGLALFAVFFSVMLSIFRSKAGGYPYTFLFK